MVVSVDAMARQAGVTPPTTFGIVDAWKAGLPESCDAVFGLSVTRLVPRVIAQVR